MSTLNIRYMLEGTPVRMRYTMRWATSRVSFPENVAEHSWFVCFYAMMIARWYVRVAIGNEAFQNNFLGKVLQRAVLHDIEEARSGDIHRPFKHSTPELKKAMFNAAKEAAVQTLVPLTNGGSQSNELLDIWENAKDDSYAGRIVRFADLLAVLAFIKQEGKDGLKHLYLDTLLPHFKEMEMAEFEFIRPLVTQAKIFMEETLNGKDVHT